MPTHTNLSLLSDAELLRHADNTRDSLTTTDLEIEITKRFGEHAELIEDLQPLIEELEDYGYDPTTNAQKIAADLDLAANVRELFDRYSIADTDALQTALQSLADDLADDREDFALSEATQA